MLSGVGLIVAGWSPLWGLISAGMFLFFLMVPYANTLLQIILHTSVEKTMLGRVGALVNALLKIVSPIACIVAGPLADKLFEPFMQADGILGKGIVGKLLTLRLYWFVKKNVGDLFAFRQPGFYISFFPCSCRTTGAFFRRFPGWFQRKSITGINLCDKITTTEGDGMAPAIESKLLRHIKNIAD